MILPSNAPQPSPAPATQLSRAQKWDLARMATAGLVTVVALAWLIPGETRQATAGQPAGREAEAAPRVTIRTTEIVVPVTPERRPEPAQPQRAAARAPRATMMAASRPAAAAPEPEPDPVARRLARLITGDGRYEVRPFPTVPPER